MVGSIKIINYLCYSISIVHISYTIYIDDMANFWSQQYATLLTLLLAEER